MTGQHSNWENDPKALVLDGCVVVDEFSEAIFDGLNRYVNQHIETGSFLRAVLENDLAGALSRADRENRTALFYIMAVIYNCAPALCWGNPEKVKAWLAGRSTQHNDPSV